jgi:hypothetical protein
MPKTGASLSIKYGGGWLTGDSNKHDDRRRDPRSSGRQQTSHFFRVQFKGDAADAKVNHESVHDLTMMSTRCSAKERGVC